MVVKQDFSEAFELISKAKSVPIVLPQSPAVDDIAAALALFLSIKKSFSKENPKTVQVGCANPVSVAVNRLFAIDKITAKIGSQNLVISFPYPESAVEKVSTFEENNRFNVLITPRDGYQSFDPKQIEYSQYGLNADLIIAIGIQNWEELGSLYKDDQAVFEKAKTIVIGVKGGNIDLGKVNLVDTQSASTSELIAELIRSVNLKIDGDIATNLLAGIESATKNFQLNATAKTFDLISWLMHQGGKREYLSQQIPLQQFPGQNNSPANIGIFGQPKPQQTQTLAEPESAVFKSQPIQPYTSAPPVTKETEAADKAQEVFSKEGQAQPSPDWFQPKVYSGKTKI